MKLSPQYVKNKFNVDWVLALIFALYFVVSITSIYLASPLVVSGLDTLVQKQILWYVTGFIIVAILIYLDPDIMYSLLKYAYWLFMFLLSLLIIGKKLPVPFVHEINGAYAWFRFPGIGTFQPSEFMKVILILMVADVISKHNSEKIESSYSEDIQLFIKVLKVSLPPLILIVLQPDTGIPLIIIMSIIAMVSVSGIKNAWILVGGGVVIGVFAIFLFIFFTNQQLLLSIFSDSYRLSRFYGWLETEKYVATWGGQLYQGLLVIGSAGLLGHPLGEAIIYFPEPQNDFIFAVIGQNFGLIGTIGVVLLSIILDIKLLSIAYHNDNQRNKIMVMGVLGMLLFQQVENMGMITGLLPITGITLPFISYGGSSLWSYMIPVAIIFKMASDNIQKNGSFLKRNG